MDDFIEDKLNQLFLVMVQMSEDGCDKLRLTREYVKLETELRVYIYELEDRLSTDEVDVTRENVFGENM